MFGPFKKSARLERWQEQQRAAAKSGNGRNWEHRRGVLSRVVVGAATVFLLSIAVQSGGGHWGPPFPYRVGEVHPRDIRVKLDFRVVDEVQTRKDQDAEADRVPPVLRLDSERLERYRDRVADVCVAALSGMPLELDPEARQLALRDEELKQLQAAMRSSPEEAAATVVVLPAPELGAAVAQASAVVAFGGAHQPLFGEADLRSRIEAAFANLLTAGILDPEERGLDDKLLPDAIKQASHYRVFRESGPSSPDPPRDQLLKSKLISTGSILQQFHKGLRRRELADVLYRLFVASDRRSIPGTLRYDPLTTQQLREAARLTVPEKQKEYTRGTLLAEQGKPLTEAQINLLKAEHRAYLNSLSTRDHLVRWTSLLAIVGMLGFLVALYIWRFMPELTMSLRRLSIVCMLIAVGAGLSVYLDQSPYNAAIIPLTMTAMILAIAFHQAFAIVVCMGMALVTTLAVGAGLERHLLVLVSGLAVTALLLRRVRTRSRLAQVGFFAGLVYGGMTVAVGMLADQTTSLIFWDAARNFFFGVIAGFFLTGLLPFVERIFGVVTDISLLELTDVSHPLLQELVRRAPGTYTHSMTVATLAEAAAEQIGANPLLTRVGACFHDIGKMLKPHYFVENQSGENRHRGLAPAMSTLIIIGHVKDGMELARQHRLPKPIIEFIQQHHGTTLVEYFYREATRLLEPGQVGAELESSFRYPGPKPQSREIGIVMLADAVEGASRALHDPAPSSLRKLVHDILLKRLLDGQFDESGLTLTELRLIEESLCKSLISLYHARVKYPEAKSVG